MATGYCFPSLFFNGLYIVGFIFKPMNTDTTIKLLQISDQIQKIVEAKISKMLLLEERKVADKQQAASQKSSWF